MNDDTFMCQTVIYIYILVHKNMKLVTMRLPSYDWNKINANVVKMYEPIFFPSGSIQILSQFIS